MQLFNMINRAQSMNLTKIEKISVFQTSNFKLGDLLAV